MSDKDRRKKDGERKDKKNQAMREAVSERAQTSEAPPQEDTDRSISNDSERADARGA
jgi:hypothetical protein